MSFRRLSLWWRRWLRRIAAPLMLMPALALSAAAMMAVPSAAQAPPPDASWRMLRTDHFRIIYTPGLEEAAARAAVTAERTHAVLRAELASAPRGVIDLVVTDHVDFTNGYATPFPGNRVVVFARPPADVPQLAYARDWIELVVAHEVVHIFHLDVAGPAGRAVRRVFGRLPMVWPIFPVAGTPTWSVEGLATYYESRLTGGGRSYGSFHEMVARVAALESRIPDLDELSTPNPLWPGGQRSYIYGSLFKRWLAERYGPEVHSEIVAATARSWLPTFLFFDHVGRKVTGTGFRALYDEWREAAAEDARRLGDELAGQGLTETAAVAESPPFAVAPRVSPDGRKVSFGAHDLRSDPATRLLDVPTGQVRRLARRNQFGGSVGPAAWLPDGSAVVTAELEYRDPYRIGADLWRVSRQGAERITRGDRLAHPDVSPDGLHAVAIRNRDGALDLVTVDLRSGATRTVRRAESGVAFMRPRWSPDGRTIAAAALLDGRVDLVSVDAAGGSVTRLTDDDAIDGAPAWSPDGRWVLWWSDRSGVSNLYALRMADGRAAGDGVQQVTNVLGGAFDPEVSPDGRWIYLSAYHADGWRIERMAFDPDSWWPAPSPVMDFREGRLGPLDPEAVEATLDRVPGRPAAHGPEREGAAAQEAQEYSAFPSVLPHFWLPLYQTIAYDQQDRQHLRFLGIYSFGWDVLRRHEWEGSLSADPWSGRLAGSGRWSYHGLGQPSLTLSGGRSWSRAGVLSLPEQRETVYRREDRIGLEAAFRRPRWRSRAFVSVGADLNRRAYDLHSEPRSVLANEDPPTLVGAVVRPSFSNARLHPLSISREDGITATFGARRWWTLEGMDRAYDQVQGQMTGYRGFGLTGFANHVAAARVSAVARFGPLAEATGIGGAAGSATDFGFGAPPLGGAALLLPVRGFSESTLAGTRAWTASTEYRVPIHLFGYRTPVLGLSLTAVSGAVFLDAGDAWCTAGQVAADVLGCTPDRTEAGTPRLVAAGAELNLDMGVLNDTPLRVRGGLAVPLRGPVRHADEPLGSPRNWQLYLRLGPSF